jgi:hypothetical protein
MVTAMLPGLPALNGSQNPELKRRGIFYEKLLRLEEDVFAGRHSQLKLASIHVRSEDVPSVAAEHSSLRPPPAPISASTPDASASRSTPSKPIPATTIDPVLLEKSDDLIKAELRFKRQRIERELRDEWAAQPRWNRPKDIVYEWEPDVADVLAKAQQLVPPVSGFELPRSSASESFDENSYYSSKANTWSSSSKEKGDAADSDAMAISSEGEVSEDDFEPQVVEVQQPPAAEPEILEIEDSDYSPPAPERSVPEPYVPVAPNQAILEAASHLFYSHAQQISVNQIQSPLAPQPSRISPLAMGKLPQIDQSQQFSEEQRPRGTRPQNNWSLKQERKAERRAAKLAAKQAKKQSRRSSPNGRNELQNPKKRRRQDQEENGGRRKRVERSPQSPQPYIKEEPVTPPPVSQVRPDSGPRRPPSAAHYQESPYSDPRRPTRRLPQIEVPAGFKLVPISDPTDYAEPSYPVYRTPGPLPPRPQAVIVDQDGNEYFAEPPTYQGPPQHRVRPAVPAGYYEQPYTHEQPARAMTYYEDHYVEEDPYQRTMAPPPPRRLIERPGTAAPEQRYAERAYSMRPPEAAGDPYTRLPVYREPYARPEQPVYREPAPPPREYSLARAYSVHPQAGPEYYRHGSVAPRPMNPPVPAIPRAMSVYPMRYASGPVPQHEARYAEAEPTDLYGDQRRVSNRF